MTARRLAIATYDEIPDLTDEDRILARALAALDVACVPWVWNTSRPDGIDAVFVRSCWDYHHRPHAFADWYEALERRGVPLANAAKTIAWNLHKGYLLELERGGVAIPETRLVKRGDDLLATIEELAPGPVVVKPAVSMSGWETHRFDAGARDEVVACVMRLFRHADVLVQAYRPEIDDGEVSIVFFGGEPSHAIRKRPAAGEFRVQSEYGGTRELIEADPAWTASARRALALAPGEVLVARVDGVIVDGRFVLMELEAIDPMVFLEWAPPEATTRFATVIRDWLDRALPPG
jgi:glutathione synthase/RimK-type ligase-like ATP-grasp enzyme